jgi:hypothetical protein
MGATGAARKNAAPCEGAGAALLLADALVDLYGGGSDAALFLDAVFF